MAFKNRRTSLSRRPMWYKNALTLAPRRQLVSTTNGTKTSSTSCTLDMIVDIAFLISVAVPGRASRRRPNRRKANPPPKSTPGHSSQLRVTSIIHGTIELDISDGHQTAEQNRALHLKVGISLHPQARNSGQMRRYVRSASRTPGGQSIMRTKQSWTQLPKALYPSRSSKASMQVENMARGL